MCVWGEGGGRCCHDAHVEVRGQLSRVGSLLPSCGFGALNSGHQALWQGSLPVEPSCQPKESFCFCFLNTREKRQKKEKKKVKQFGYWAKI